MMTSEPRTINKLHHLPETFKNFSEFKKKGKAHIFVDRRTALDWMSHNGMYLGKKDARLSSFLGISYYLVFLGFIAYVVLTRDWILFVGTPLLLLGFALHPSMKIALKGLYTFLFLLIWGGLIYGFLTERTWLIVFPLCLILISFFIHITYKTALRAITTAALQHEDLFCILWEMEALSLRYKNGDVYFRHFKIEDGKHTHYKN